MPERIIDRFDKYMIEKQLNDNQVTVQLGLSVGLLGKSRQEGRDISKKVIEKITVFYPDIERIWLLTGEGEMLKSDRHRSNIVQEPAPPYGGYVPEFVVREMIEERKQHNEQMNRMINILEQKLDACLEVHSVDISKARSG